MACASKHASSGAASVGGPGGGAHAATSSTGAGGSSVVASSGSGVPAAGGASSASSTSGAGGAAGGGGAGGSGPAAVRWLGRVDDSNPSAVKFAWSGTGFIATVAGPTISVLLQTEGATSSAFFQPVIDGVVGTRFQVPTGAQQKVTLGSGLSAGDHTVELYRETEGSFGDSIFLGFADGVLKAAPPASGRLIEVIGDSISAGYGNLGMEVHPPSTNTCTFSLDTESAYASYAELLGRTLNVQVLGRTLNAEVSIIARSGWGMYRDGSGSTSNVLSSVYGNTLGETPNPAWDFKRQPDVVLINLGTNDAATGDPGTPYETAYVSFLKTVRGHYPAAWIFLTMGPMTSDPLLTQMRQHITNVVSMVNDSKILSVDLAVQDPSMTGCDYHPNVAEDGVMAAALAPTIKSKLGW
jgi:lysophospholipase L1-like esterase